MSRQVWQGVLAAVSLLVVPGAPGAEALAAPPAAALPEPAARARAPKVTVIGGVTRPGTIDLEGTLRVRKAIDLAGGLLPGGSLTQVILIRKDLSWHILDLSKPEWLADPDRNRLLKDGDILVVPGPVTAVAKAEDQAPAPANSIFIVGAIPNPGPQPFKPGQTLREFLLDASADLGRMLSSAKIDLKNVLLLRGGRVKRIDLPQVLKNPRHRDNLVVEPGDVLFLPEKSRNDLPPAPERRAPRPPSIATWE